MLVNVFIFSLLGIVAIFLLYPVWVILITLIKPASILKRSAIFPTVSIINIVRDSGALLTNKLTNLHSLDYHHQLMQIVICLDGTSDNITINNTDNPINTVFMATGEHIGKNKALNLAVAKATGEILVFTDADGLLPTDSLTELMSYFADPTVGGVCGKRSIGETANLANAQQTYIDFDSWIKTLENNLGSISSNDGKLYAMRRELFTDIPSDVTDDLYNALNVIAQNKRFVFASQVTVSIKKPSRHGQHEIERRRRIVCRSLKGISSNKILLNPLRYGLFSFSLFFNKIMRRLLPFFLILLLITSLFTQQAHFFILLCLIWQVIFYFIALTYLSIFSHFKLTNKITSIIFYFCVGNIGTLLGVIDFLSGKSIDKWEPLKQNK